MKNPPWRRIPEEAKELIEQLLLEKIPLAEIARVLQISELWLQNYVFGKDEVLPRQLRVPPKPKGRLIVPMDKLWSFVDDKGHAQWVWLALDVFTREIVGCYIGRSEAHSASTSLGRISKSFLEIATLRAVYR